MLVELDSENADRDLTSLVTVLTHTPDASNITMCQGLIALGDGTKDLDGSGGDFELVVTIGGQTIQPSPQIMNFGTEVRSSVLTMEFPVPANNEVIMRVKSPNAADTDVDVTAILYEIDTAASESEMDLIDSPNVTAIAALIDAVCDELLSGHTTPGTLAKAISDITLTGLGTTAVDHNFGGTDALRYVDGVGSGIDNADIMIYLKSDYDAGNLASAYVKAKTNTDVNGQWANPLNLDPAIYTVYFYKQGEYGPDTQEITVT